MTSALYVPSHRPKCGPDRGLNGIVDLDETMLDSEAQSEVRPERLHAVALGGVMPGGDVGDAAFAREVHRLLRNLAAHEGVDAEAHRVFEIALRGAGAPCDPP